MANEPSQEQVERMGRLIVAAVQGHDFGAPVYLKVTGNTVEFDDVLVNHISTAVLSLLLPAKVALEEVLEQVKAEPLHNDKFWCNFCDGSDRTCGCFLKKVDSAYAKLKELGL